MRTLHCLLALVLLLATRDGARADTASTAQRSEASSHFRRGVELFEEEAYRAALVEFERAYEIAPDYRLFYNIGQTKLRLQDYLGVVQSYESYLSQGGSAVPPERRQQVEEALIALRDRIGRVAVTCNRSDVEITIDEQVVGKTPVSGTMPVNVGQHRISVRAPDGVSDSRVISVAGGDVTDVAFQLPLPTEVASAQPQAAEKPGWSSLRKGAVVSWSVGAALLVGSAVTGTLAIREQSKVDDMLAEENLAPESLQDGKDKVQALSLTTDVLIGAGAAAVVAGTVLWFVDKRRPREDKAERTKPARLSLQLGPTSAAVRGVF